MPFSLFIFFPLPLLLHSFTDDLVTLDNHVCLQPPLGSPKHCWKGKWPQEELRGGGESRTFPHHFILAVFLLHFLSFVLYTTLDIFFTCYYDLVILAQCFYPTSTNTYKHRAKNEISRNYVQCIWNLTFHLSCRGYSDIWLYRSSIHLIARAFAWSNVVSLHSTCAILQPLSWGWGYHAITITNM